MADQDKGEKEQPPTKQERQQTTQQSSARYEPSRVDRLDSILLKGRVYEVKEGESITLEAHGALLTVRYEDINEVRELSKDESELLVKSNAKIIYETLLNPQEVEGILSKDLMIEIGSAAREPTECSRCVPTECSRCAGTECSRCVGFENFRSVPTECSRCVGTECSRCVDTECSRCLERTNLPSGGGGAGTFRRRLT
jgi:hypothetical protein